MVKVEEIEQIRQARFRDHKSIHKIAKEFHRSRPVVRKALQDAGPPKFGRKEWKSPVMGPVVPIVEQWLQEDLSRPANQRHTAHRVYRRLKEDSELHFQGSESTVRRYVHDHRPQRAFTDVFIPLEYSPGADAQCDFGEAQVVFKGQKVTANVFCMRLCYSKRSFVMAFPHQGQEVLFAGHVAAFDFFGGAPQRVIYDNLKTAVKKILEGHKREEQNAFIAFRSHYLFESRFCTPAQGHEKGLVEGLVGYSRRNFLVPVPEVDSYEQLNGLLLLACQAEDVRRLEGEKRTIGELWHEERPQLRPLPAHAFDCCRVQPARANRFSLVTFETNHYSIPVVNAHEELTLRAYVHQVKIAVGDRDIAVHGRCYEREQDILDPLHYLPLLIQRPGALGHAKPFKQLPAVYQEYLRKIQEQQPDGLGTREFVRILALHEQYSLAVMTQALQKALTCHCYSCDGVQNLAQQLALPSPVIPLLDLAGRPHLLGPHVEMGDLSRYNQLLTVGRA